jgi:hypothetical protein
MASIRFSKGPLDQNKKRFRKRIRTIDVEKISSNQEQVACMLQEHE